MYFLTEILPWVLMITGITSTFIQGNRDRRGWILGLATTIGFIVYTAATKQWPLIPLNVVLGGVQIRNYFKK